MLATIHLLRFFVLAAFAFFVARDAGRRHPEHLPWTPLDLAAPVGWATAGKLAALRDHPAQCRALLAAAGVTFVPVGPRRDGPACSLNDAGHATGFAVPLLPADAVMSCPLAAALTIYTRRVVLPATGGRASAITTFGTYNCRRIAGTDRPSEHATANAVDLAGVRLRGSDISIVRDWRRDDARGRLARSLRDGACRLFGVVLSPDYNAAHRDHLHLDLGRGRICS